jgi:hypothetical protein
VELAVVAEPSAPSVRTLVSALACSAPVTVLPRDGYLARLRPSDILVGASSTGDQIDERQLPPGTLVIDVSLPRDVMYASRRRDDILVVDGEVVRLPGASDGVADFFGCGDGHVLACFAETCVLAMEGRTDSFTIGRDILPEKVEEIGGLAEKHGFAVDRLYGSGRPVSEERFDRVRSLAKRRGSWMPVRRAARRADGQILLPAVGQYEGTGDGNG